MSSHHLALDEGEITGEMPAVPCPVYSITQERNFVPAQTDGLRVAGTFLQEDEELTIVEPVRNIPAPSAFHRFIFWPHYKTALSIELHRYLRGVRVRARQSRESHRRFYPDSGFRKIRRLFGRFLRHARKNLAEK